MPFYTLVIHIDLWEDQYLSLSILRLPQLVILSGRTIEFNSGKQA